MTVPVCGKTAEKDALGLTLALNAAEDMLQIVIADDQGRLLHSQEICTASRGVEVLVPALDAAFRLLGKKPEEISRVAVVQGPGSFTGLRLVSVTAAGLARVACASQAGIDYMALLARECAPALCVAGADALLWVLVRARRDLVYMQAFRLDEKAPSGLCAVTNLEVHPVAPENTAVAQILDTAASHGCSSILLAGSGAEGNRDALTRGLSVPDAPRVVSLAVRSAGPEKLLAAALAAAYGNEDIVPLYVRSSDAEENLPQIAQRLGNDPKESVQRLFALTHATATDMEGA